MQRNKAQAIKFFSVRSAIMRTLLYFSLRNAIKRKQDLFSLKRSASCAKPKNNLLKRFATFAQAGVAQIALCASNCGMLTSENTHASALTKLDLFSVVALSVIPFSLYVVDRALSFLL